MSEEWKPGDVAICQSHSARVVKAEAHGQWWHPGYEVPQSLPDRAVRPLVVIDPEDREAVERLLDLYFAATVSGATSRDDMQAALREFADPKPPRPDEPMGLGAVVEDANGYQWLLVAPGLGEYRWAKRNETAGNWKRYADIDAVKVLSEGVR